MTRRIGELWGEQAPLDQEKGLPGGSLETHSCVLKSNGARGVFRPSAGTQWGIFEGENGVKITVNAMDVRGPGERVDVLEEIMASIDGVRRDSA